MDSHLTAGPVTDSPAEDTGRTGGTGRAMSPEELVELAGSEPARALELATSQVPRTTGRLRAMARHAAGRALWNLGSAPESVRELELALNESDLDAELTNRIATSLAASLGYVGRFDDAMSHLDRVLVTATGLAAARAEHQRAGLLQRAGESGEARLGYRRALAEFRRHRDHTWEGHLHTNLSILATYEGRIDEALVELDLAMGSYRTAGQLRWIAITIHNRGWTIGSTGDLPRALQLFDEAEAQLAELGVPEGPRLAIRAEALLRAGLVDRAWTELDAATAELRRLGLETDYAETLILTSRAAGRSGRREEAAALAAEAGELLTAQGRPGWAALALAAEAEYRPSVDAEPDAESVVDAVVAAGHRVAGFHLRLVLADRAIDRGDPQLARHHLRSLPEIDETPVERARRAMADGRWRAATGRLDEAVACYEWGYGILDELLGRFGSLDMIAGSARTIDRLVQRAKEALPAEDLEGHTRWADRRRAIGALRWPLATDATTAALLNRYRALDAQLETDPADAATRADLATVRSQLKRQAWTAEQARSPGRPIGDPAVSSPELWSGPDRQVIDLSYVDGRTRITRSGPDGDRWWECSIPADLVPALDRVHQLWMVASPDRSPALGRRFAALAQELDRVLFGPETEADDRPIPTVVIPDPEYRSIPFSGLPSLQGAPQTVAPWRRATVGAGAGNESPAGPRKLLLPDPTLRSAEPERQQLGGGDGCTVLDHRATVDEVIDRMGRSDLLHVSTHGGVEPDNPMFNWLGLAGGRLYLHDLTRVETMPEGVVLACCLGARAGTHGAAGALSFAEAFLGAGARWVIAGATAVPDDHATAGLIGRLHRLLDQGLEPEEALYRAKAGAADDDGLRAGAAFGCYGLPWSRSTDRRRAPSTASPAADRRS